MCAAWVGRFVAVQKKGNRTISRNVCDRCRHDRVQPGLVLLIDCFLRTFHKFLRNFHQIVIETSKFQPFDDLKLVHSWFFWLLTQKISVFNRIRHGHPVNPRNPVITLPFETNFDLSLQEASEHIRCRGTERAIGIWMEGTSPGSGGQKIHDRTFATTNWTATPTTYECKRSSNRDFQSSL